MATSIFGNQRKKFSIENALFLCDEVQRLENGENETVVTNNMTSSRALSNPSASPPRDTGIFVEALRELVEVVVWGDKHEEQVFDIFLERSIMRTFENSVTNPSVPSEVKVQVIQCVTILLQNLSRQQSTYFVCSNNHINKIIGLDVDPDDEELLSNYVSFLKSLCLRLNEESVQFFFQQKISSGSPTDSGSTFPLFSQAVKLLSSDDQMVRAAARQIVLCVVQLRDSALVEYMQTAIDPVLNTIAGLINKQLEAISKQLETREKFVENGSKPFITAAALDNKIEDLLDDLYYLNDFFEIQHDFVAPELLAVLEEHVIDGKLIPAIDSALEFGSFPNSSVSSSSSVLSMPLSLLMLGNWIRVNTNKQLHQLLLGKLFQLISSDNDQQNVSLCLESCRTVRVLRDAKLLRSHAAAMVIIQSTLSSKLTCTEVRQSLLSVGTCAAIEPMPKKPLPSACEWSGIRPTLGDYRLATQQGGRTFTVKPEIEAMLMADAVKDAVTRFPLFGAVYESVTAHVTRKELIRLQAFQYALMFFVVLVKECSIPPVVVDSLLTKISLQAQLHLMHRVESYRQHLWMLFGGSGETSTLTPSSLLCQLLGGGNTAGLSGAVMAPDREIVDPFEPLFIRIERDFAAITSTFCTPLASVNPQAFSTTKTGRDAALLFPITPSITSWSSQASLFLDGDIRTAEKHVAAYSEMQQRCNAGLPLPRRAPQDENETEYCEVAVWLMLRSVYFRSQCDCTDPLPQLFGQFSSKKKVKDVVRSWDLATSVDIAGVRCEYAPGEGSTEFIPSGLSSVAVGTVLYLFIEGADLFFVEPAKDAPESTGTVVCSMRLLYTEAAIHHKQLFRLCITEETPMSTSKISVVVRDRSTCQQVAQTIQRYAAARRHDAAALVHSLLVDDVSRSNKNVIWCE